MATNQPIVIGNLKFEVVQKRWAVEMQDVLQVWRLDATYPYPTWEIPRHDTSYGHIWALYEEVIRLRAPGGVNG